MTPTLLAFLDDVEHNRIPADELQHRTRLARNAFKAALAEAVRAEREACALLGENEVREHRDRARELLERVRDDQLEETRANLVRHSISSGTIAANIEDIVQAIRSRPSPDVAVVPTTASNAED